MQTENLQIEQIKKLYPNQWVLIAEPQIQNTLVLGGIVLFNSKDKREIAYKRINWREKYTHATTIYTGSFPKNRKFWL